MSLRSTAYCHCVLTAGVLVSFSSFLLVLLSIFSVSWCPESFIVPKSVILHSRNNFISHITKASFDNGRNLGWCVGKGEERAHVWDIKKVKLISIYIVFVNRKGKVKEGDQQNWPRDLEPGELMDCDSMNRSKYKKESRIGREEVTFPCHFVPLCPF